jgi:branched-chain amino acid transport system substrate-binding protein
VAVDDASTAAGNATASHDLVQNQRAFGVIGFSPFTFGGARVFQQAGVPVTGAALDGPEWGQQPYSNMFSWYLPFYTPYNGKFYNYSYTGKFLQSVGVTKAAGLAYGISPSSQSSIKAVFAASQSVGISNCYTNYSVPFGGVDFTAAVLAIKSAGCNGVVGSFVDASDVALTTALHQAGVQSKNMFFTGYDQATLATPSAKAAFQDAYFASILLFDPSTVPAVGTMLANLKKYDPSYKGGIPDIGAYGSYIAADLMIKGLEGAGQNPTRKSFISNLRQVTNYTAGGLFPSPVPFTGFGTDQMLPSQNCEYFVQLKGDRFVNSQAGGKPICGSRISFKAS